MTVVCAYVPNASKDSTHWSVSSFVGLNVDASGEQPATHDAAACLVPTGYCIRLAPGCGICYGAWVGEAGKWQGGRGVTEVTLAPPVVAMLKWLHKTPPFLNVFYVCPEPVLAN